MDPSQRKPRYFFHNVYGDADELLATKPDDIIAVPFGWDGITEDYRNSLLLQLNAVVSCLPCVIYWKEETSYTDSDGVTTVIPAHWHEYRFEQEDKPWTWINVPLSS
jgi:hypothetical protein